MKLKMYALAQFGTSAAYGRGKRIRGAFARFLRSRTARAIEFIFDARGMPVREIQRHPRELYTVDVPL
jgi:hypothetical protein